MSDVRRSQWRVRSRRLAVYACGLTAALCGAMTPTAAADDGPPVHRVTYTVTADRPTAVGIYYRDVDPPTWADYSHDPYRFSPRDDVHLEPGIPWVHEATLADPDQWAMVAVTAVGLSTSDAMGLRCRLAVDGVDVDGAEGPRGALCSLRHW